ncbi:unnamed protein product [Polarella glacialis]|uniref:Uncharacterized protein n=1 Tax=Polarella glacialis TaxID=89957 RepID=A0A813GN07_POLGL|nr:unnamed protein product [Polarella glacialis]CAE8628404.1 unnamed protein product [Polarella glacialis]
MVSQGSGPQQAWRRPGSSCGLSLQLFTLLAVAAPFVVMLLLGIDVLPMFLGPAAHGRSYRHGQSEATRGQSDTVPQVPAWLFQGIFATVYYWMVVRSYRALDRLPLQMRHLKILDENPCGAMRHVSLPNGLLSCYCQSARAAHTFEKTGASKYWIGFLAVACFPCCTVSYLQNETREALGAKRLGLPTNLCYSIFCTFCLVAQQAEALDVATGQRSWSG